MLQKSDIKWFKEEFGSEIESALASTEAPLGLELLTALACHETGQIWSVLRHKNLPRAKLLELCVGDTLDSDRGRRAFPQTKADLTAKTDGDRMFAIARQALIDLAQHVPPYRAAAAKPNKFCHGFGIFQYDLQFFLKEPVYFLEKKYADFDACLARCIQELTHAVRKLAWTDKRTLTDYEMATIAIIYNTGRFVPSKGLRQGYFDGAKYYGESILEYLRLARTVRPEGEVASSGPRAGRAAVALPTPVEANGATFEVEVLSDRLRLRREPRIPAANPSSNVIAYLPDGHRVKATPSPLRDSFREVETSVLGAHHRGWAADRFLRPVADQPVPVVTPASSEPQSGVTAVYMPRKAGTITRRTELAGAHSLNEAEQPVRKGAGATELKAELANIVDWLSVDKPSHKRYAPRDGRTFCNIYAHDYCFLAGVYLPRVWWTAGAIEAIASGQHVEPKYGQTIDEQRANDLLRWLRDFGARFGWRQTGTLTKLQTEVNLGAVGLIVARRVEDGRPGHISVVVPETDEHSARRATSGEVLAPLQSQAGTKNFKYGTSKADWWKGSQFAEGAYWLHA